MNSALLDFQRVAEGVVADRRFQLLAGKTIDISDEDIKHLRTLAREEFQLQNLRDSNIRQEIFNRKNS